MDSTASSVFCSAPIERYLLIHSFNHLFVICLFVARRTTTVLCRQIYACCKVNEPHVSMQANSKCYALIAPLWTPYSAASMTSMFLRYLPTSKM